MGYILAFFLGGIGTYWISDTVKNNIEQINLQTQYLLANQEEFNRRFYEKLLELEQSGELPQLINKLKESGILVQQTNMSPQYTIDVVPG